MNTITITDDDFDELEQAAHDNNSIAQRTLAGLYESGIYVDMDLEKAVFWYQKASENGDYKAQKSLGLMYCRGIGIKQDCTLVKYWFQKALSQECTYAKINLEYLNSDGSIFTLDPASAIKLYRKAFYNIAIMHFTGNGARQNYDRAVRLFTKAANMGDYLAHYELAKMYYTGEGVRQDYGQAIIWLEKALNEDILPQITDGVFFTGVEIMLGKMYLDGKGVALDTTKAMELLQKAADLGNEEAQQLSSKFHHKK